MMTAYSRATTDVQNVGRRRVAAVIGTGSCAVHFPTGGVAVVGCVSALPSFNQSGSKVK